MWLSLIKAICLCLFINSNIGDLRGLADNSLFFGFSFCFQKKLKQKGKKKINASDEFSFSLSLKVDEINLKGKNVKMG